MFKRLAACIVWFQEISIPSTVGIFALDPRPPSHPHPLEFPSLSNMVGFPLWEKYFRQKMLLLYTIMRKNMLPPDPGLPLRNFRCPPVEGRYGYFWN